MAEQTATLEPGESRVISFEATPEEVKTFQVAVDGLNGTFRAAEAPVEEVDFELARPTASDINLNLNIPPVYGAFNCGVVHYHVICLPWRDGE
ncbi:unnamed protein product [marine sediment metagenome]|uniref:Uncharacterized protein n=1 Tax=marine sediment metagenome TaxID=412755 RepID=X1S0N0_9ZZZZ